MCVRVSGWICIKHTISILFCVCMREADCLYISAKTDYMLMRVCVCTTADTHRDTGLSPPVCTISSNDDTL